MEGAADRQKDQLANHIQGAYYFAYWNNAKHPKDLNYVLNKIYKPTNNIKPDVDVDAFLEQKRRFEAYGGFKNNKNSGVPATR